MTTSTLRAACCVTLFSARLLGAQSRDTLRLPDVVAAALAADPRSAQLDLNARQSALRQRSLGAERLPALTGEGSAQYQSDVARVPVPNVASPPHDTYDARVGAQLRLLDPTHGPRRAVERAQLDESQAGVRTTLYALRQEATDAYFAAAAASTRRDAIETTIAALETRVQEAAARVKAGSALPSDSLSLAAALLQRRQDALQAAADRRAALRRLAALTGTPIADATTLALPTLDDAYVAGNGVADSARARPEFAQLDATRERLTRQEALATAQERPRVSAFARAGYGRPGLNPLASTFDTYWLGGVQVQWQPFTWGTSRRDREVLALQRDVVTTNERALARQLARAIEPDRATVERLDATIALDADIVALRARVERETRARLGEGVVTAGEYADREAELLAARLAAVDHRIARTQAQARVLNTLGLEIPR